MPDRPLTRDTRAALRDARAALAEPHFGESYIVVGLVLVCVLMAVALLWAGMISEKSTTQPASQAPVTTQSDSQAPAITQPSTPTPATP